MFKNYKKRSAYDLNEVGGLSNKYLVRKPNAYDLNSVGGLAKKIFEVERLGVLDKKKINFERCSKK